MFKCLPAKNKQKQQKISLYSKTDPSVTYTSHAKVMLWAFTIITIKQFGTTTRKLLVCEQALYLGLTRDIFSSSLFGSHARFILGASRERIGAEVS